MKSPTTTRAALACLLLGFCCAVQAQLFRSYLSSTGSDSNPCTLPAPCRLLPAALAAVANGGEIWMLDSGNFNTGTVNVEKSVTVLAIPGALGSLVAPDGGYAVTLYTGNTRVAFRNVVFRALGAALGAIHDTEAAYLSIEDCRFYATGIFAIRTPGIAPARINVERSAFRDMGVGLDIRGSFRVSIVDVHVANGSRGNDRGGIQAFDGANVAINGGSITGMTQSDLGLVARSTGPGYPTTRVLLSGTQISGNDYGIGAYNAGSPIEVILDNVKITHNVTGISMSAGAVFSRQNNTIVHNEVNVSGGSLTSIAPM